MARRLALAALALVVAGAACNSMPKQGVVHELGRVPVGDGGFERGVPVRREPTRPRAGATPDEIVRGFLDAAADATGSYRIARSFLVPVAAWDPRAEASVYRGREIKAGAERGDTATVTVSFVRSGIIAAAGEFRPVAENATETYSLRRVDGEWRLAEVPPGLWLAENDLLRGGSDYRRLTRYYPDRSRRHLVPDAVLVPADRQDLALTAVRNMLAEPSAWLRPVVRSAIPAGTRLLGTPEIDDDTLVVNFSNELRRAPSETLPALMSQIVWTLTDPEVGVSSVRIEVEGEPFAIAGRKLTRPQQRSDWADLHPDPTPADTRPYLVQDGRLVAIDDDGEPVVTWPATRLETAAPSPAGLGVVGVRRESASRVALVSGALSRGSEVTVVHRAAALTAPTWERDGTVAWSVARTSSGFEVVVVPVDSRQAPVPRVRLALPGNMTAVHSLKLSRDGVRAALVGEINGARRLYQAQVQPQPDGSRAVTALRPIAPRLSGVLDVVWADAATLVALVGERAGTSVVRLAYDGYGLATISTAGLPGPPTAIADAPGLGLLAATKDAVWQRELPGGWRRVARGSAPVYAG